MRYGYLLGLWMISALAGCGNLEDSTGTAESTAGPQADAESVDGDKESVVGGKTDANGDFRRWLAPPDKGDEELEKLINLYTSLFPAVNEKDPQSQYNLALVSQQIASQLARANNLKMAYRFSAQSGAALRAAINSGLEQASQQVNVGQVYFNEASALAWLGETGKALDALDEAVKSGFMNLDAIEQEERLAAVRAHKNFPTRMQSWQKTISDKIYAMAVEDLEAAKSFAFELSGTDLSGQPVSLDALRGQVVVVDIWGTWCPPCRAEVPSFIKLQDKFGKDGFQMIGVNYEREGSPEADRQAVENFIEETGINYPCLLGDDSIRQQVPNFRAFPTTLFIDKSGTVRMKAEGMHPYPYLEAVVSVLVNEK